MKNCMYLASFGFMMHFGESTGLDFCHKALCAAEAITALSRRLPDETQVVGIWSNESSDVLTYYVRNGVWYDEPTWLERRSSK